MNEWEEVVEEGVTYYINKQYGNIVKLNDNSYVCIIPKTYKLGPFDSLEEAKIVTVQNSDDIGRMIHEFNLKLISK
jgi:hypothetical protein